MRRIDMRLIRTTGLLLLLVLSRGTAVPAFAQSSSATVLGTVTDESGGALPGVTITATNRDNGFTREVVTSETGVYRLAALPPGTYDVKASLAGFADALQKGITLVVLQDVTV